MDPIELDREVLNGHTPIDLDPGYQHFCLRRGLSWQQRDARVTAVTTRARLRAGRRHYMQPSTLSIETPFGLNTAAFRLSALTAILDLSI
jgi:hypothetical protein